jgi:hypothetical protein
MEANDPGTELFESFCSCLVNLDLILVDKPIDFDPESGLVAIKIDDELFDRMLPSKFQSSQPPTAQATPQDSLSACDFRSEFSGALEQNG